MTPNDLRATVERELQMVDDATVDLALERIMRAFALASTAAEGEWMEIKSAPREGTQIDVWSTLFDRRLPNAWWGSYGPDGPARWLWPDEDDFPQYASKFTDDTTITHWLPVPKRPPSSATPKPEAASDMPPNQPPNGPLKA